MSHNSLASCVQAEHEAHKNVVAEGLEDGREADREAWESELRGEEARLDRWHQELLDCQTALQSR
jgi:hypothetical protein